MGLLYGTRGVVDVCLPSRCESVKIFSLSAVGIMLVSISGALNISLKSSSVLNGGRKNLDGGVIVDVTGFSAGAGVVSVIGGDVVDVCLVVVVCCVVVRVVVGDVVGTVVEGNDVVVVAFFVVFVVGGGNEVFIVDLFVVVVIVASVFVVVVVLSES